MGNISENISNITDKEFLTLIKLILNDKIDRFDMILWELLDEPLVSLLKFHFNNDMNNIIKNE